MVVIFSIEEGLLLSVLKHRCVVNQVAIKKTCFLVRFQETNREQYQPALFACVEMEGVTGQAENGHAYQRPVDPCETKKLEDSEFGLSESSGLKEGRRSII